MFNFFHSQPLPMTEYLAREEDADDILDTLPCNIPAPRNVGKPAGADSIMIVSAGTNGISIT